jgi:hypothetical protein
LPCSVADASICSAERRTRAEGRLQDRRDERLTDVRGVIEFGPLKTESSRRTVNICFLWDDWPRTWPHTCVLARRIHGEATSSSPRTPTSPSAEPTSFHGPGQRQSRPQGSSPFQHPRSAPHVGCSRDQGRGAPEGDSVAHGTRLDHHDVEHLRAPVQGHGRGARAVARRGHRRAQENIVQLSATSSSLIGSPSGP